MSASALKTEGQLIVLNCPPLPAGDEKGGPCYRCVFPKPPPAESVVSCGDGGIIGPVVGVMGVMQALEAIKLIASGRLGGDSVGTEKPSNTMLLFAANGIPQFRSLKMRGRSPKCLTCSANADMTLETLKCMDYAFFCGVTAPVNILGPEMRVEAKEYDAMRAEGRQHLLVDVRDEIQFDMCNIDGSINVPFSTFQGHRESDETGESPSWLSETLSPDAPIYLVCRLGNDSQVVAKKLKDSGLDNNGIREIKDIKGGLRAWKQQVDSSWPEY